MQTPPESSAAPALERGLYILETLQASGPLSLENLATACQIPKSSLLRLLDTLQARGYVQRRDSDKQYLNRVSLIVQAPQERSPEEIIQFTLETLSQQLGFTTEWYSPQNDHALLTQRTECRDSAVQVLARIGYKRSWWEELDAVARIGHVALPLSPTLDQQKACTRYQQGVLIPHSASSYKQALKDLNIESPCVDTEYNANGIRRMAKGILDQEGKLLGIIAVPMHFQPDAEHRLPERLDLLQHCSLRLQTQLQETS
ncbi:helix-turn-helix domain-containing protein [Kiritimatiellota bacterium B12222]|nr:helix-turn-helix domain-containing protein [Kiritimatiellota bacterium B12222]